MRTEIATQEASAPVIACVRHRLQSDGKGVCTLVCFHGCPLRCHWCLNPFSFDPATPRKYMTAEQLYEKVKIDALYFIATGGGVTFGGGEPLLYPHILQQFRQLCGPEWHLCVQTSLSVPWENVRIAASCIDMFYVDCKSADPEIYRSYTGVENSIMLENLRRLLEIIPEDRIQLRVPLIPDYNTVQDQEKSRRVFEKMGIRNFDFFPYIKDRNELQ